MPNLGVKELPPDWKARFGYVYVFENAGLRKIGSSKKPEIRLRAMKTAAPSIEAIHHIPSLSYAELEKLLHVHFADKRVAGEWFRLSDAQPRKKSRKVQIEEQLKRSDLTAFETGRTDIEYGHFDSLPRGEHVARLKR